MAENKKKGKKTAGNIIRNIVLVLAIGVFCFSGYHVIDIVLEYKQGTDEYEELEQYVDIGNEGGTQENSETNDNTQNSSQEDEINMEETSIDEFGTVIIGDIIDSEEDGLDAQAVENENETTQAAEGSARTVSSAGESDEETSVIMEDENGNVKILGKIAKVKKRVDFEELQEINSDIIGWLYVEAIDTINYPIVQTDDNAYYLTHTFKKTDNIAGSIFLDCDTKPNFTDTNSVIYGHNMRNGSMFGKLNRFYDEETYEDSKYFWVYTPDLYYKYEIFSCAEVGAISESYQRQFETKNDYRDYLQRMQENSIIKTDTELTAGDKIVTLSTCTASSDVRFIVQGKLVRAYQIVDPDATNSTQE